MYKFESVVRFSELDETGKLAVPKIVDYFQDCSNFQSDAYGVGHEYLMTNHLAWVLSFWQIVIHRRPRGGERIAAGTFPYEFKGFFGFRNFLMEDAAGDRIVSANSLWTLLNMQSGRPVKAGPEITDKYQLEERLPMEYAPRKLVMPEGGRILEPVRVGRAHLDLNQHVNNAKYIGIGMNYVPADAEVKELRVEYKNQAHLGALLCPYVADMEGGIAVSLQDEAGKPYVNMHFMY